MGPRNHEEETPPQNVCGNDSRKKTAEVSTDVERHQVLVAVELGPLRIVAGVRPDQPHGLVDAGLSELGRELHHALRVGPALVEEAEREDPDAELVADGGISELGKLTVASVLDDEGTAVLALRGEDGATTITVPEERIRPLADTIGELELVYRGYDPSDPDVLIGDGGTVAQTRSCELCGAETGEPALTDDDHPAGVNLVACPACLDDPYRERWSA